MRVLITGGAGFVGSALALHFLHAGHAVDVVDNLRRRGSELNMTSLSERGASFHHGDVRNPTDFDDLEGSFDLLIEASAEPSVHAGVTSSARYVLDTNLVGAVNCLEFASVRCGALIFLSSSRVYPIASLASLPLRVIGQRFDLAEESMLAVGVSRNGIAERFSCDGVRSFYGAAKLAAELLCQEYSAHRKLPVVIDRCGVIAGPGQFGRTDQGVFTKWIAHHCFGRPLAYSGFGCKGLQVRDLLHPLDLCSLIDAQVARLSELAGSTFNVGGGREGSVSLAEYTSICREVIERDVPIGAKPESSSVDIPWYVTDNAKVTEAIGWAPQRRPAEIVRDTAAWIRENEAVLSRII